MKRGFRSFLALIGVFLATFAIVILIRNGPTGLRQIFSGSPKGNGYRPETYTLPDHAPLDLGDVELLTRLNEEYAKLTDAVVKSVVSIDTSGVRAERLLDGFGRQLIRPVPTQGQGSGVIVTHEGHIVTNHHVIKNQQKIEVTLHNGEKFNATLVGDDPLLDIAVLKIDGGGEFEPLKLGDSSTVRRGQIAFAIGNPFGLGETITQGIISAVDRSVSDTQRDLFQTDAAINPGNSGGPLVNLRGEVIGINSAIYRPDERVNPGFQGVGFSIPSNEVRSALEAILERGRPIRGYLGVRMRDLDAYVRRELGYRGTGAMVERVGPGSPAQKGGLRALDVIRTYDGQPIETVAALLNMVQRSKVGRTIPVEVWRSGEVVNLQITISEANRPAANANQQGSVESSAESFDEIGIGVVDPDDGSVGLEVKAISPGSIADGRLQVGDRIIGINGATATDAEDFKRQLLASASAQTTALQIIRGTTAGRITLPPMSAGR